MFYFHRHCSIKFSPTIIAPHENVIITKCSMLIRQHHCHYGMRTAAAKNVFAICDYRRCSRPGILQTITKNNTKLNTLTARSFHKCQRESRFLLFGFPLFPPLRAHFSFNYSRNMEQLFILTNACICGIILCHIQIIGGSESSFNSFFLLSALMRSVASIRKRHKKCSSFKIFMRKTQTNEEQKRREIVMLNEALAEVQIIL